MLLTRVAETGEYIVKFNGNSFWFNSEESARKFMKKIEDKYLYQ